MNAAQFWQDKATVAQQSPVIHNITNFVVMNTTANALYAIGAAPIMAHALEELESIMSISAALVVNIGTLDNTWIQSMRQAASIAKRLKKPVVLDPVGVGASQLRINTALTLLEDGGISILRGNSSEIMALAGEVFSSRGVDSAHSSNQAFASANRLAKDFKLVVACSGEKDYITNGTKACSITGGSPLMGKVTGMGCTSSALCGAYIACQPDAYLAACSALGHMAAAGTLTAEKAQGIGTFQMHFLDSLSLLDRTNHSEYVSFAEQTLS